MARKQSTTTTKTTTTKKGRPPEAAGRPSGPATMLAQSLPEVMVPEEELATEPSDAAEPAEYPDEEPVTPEGAGPDQPQPAAEGQPERQWAPPYRAAFTSALGGLEVGEDRRFKQVVVSFADRPSSEVTDRLKEAGFKFRPAERSWTAPASAVAREFAHSLAQELHLLAGGNTPAERGR